MAEENSGEIPVNTERVASKLSEIYHLSRDCEVSKEGTHIKMHDPEIRGTVGLDFEDRSDPAPYFYPDPETTPHTLPSEEVIDLLGMLNRAKPTDPAKQISAGMKGMMPFFVSSPELVEHGVNIVASLKELDISPLEVIHLGYKGEEFVARIPLWWHRLSSDAHDVVAEAIAIAKMAAKIGQSIEPKISVPYARDFIAIAPFFTATVDTFPLGQAVKQAKVNLHGYLPVVHAEMFKAGDKNVIIDPVTADSDYQKRGDTKRQLVEVLK